MLNLFKTILFCFLCAAVAGCGKSDDANAVQPDAPGHKVESRELSEFKDKINTIADKYLSGNAAVKNEWIKMQLQAFDSINSYLPDIDLRKFAEIKESAQKKNPEDCVKAYNDMLRQIDGFKSLDRSKYSDVSAYDFAIKHIGELYPGDYVEQSRQISKWIDFYSALKAACRDLPEGAAADFEAAAVSEARKGVDNGKSYLSSQKFAKSRLESKSIKNMTSANVHRIKEFVAKKYPSDFIQQLEELENIERLYMENNKLDIDGLILKKAETSAGSKNLSKSKSGNRFDKLAATSDSLREKAEDIFRNCVFTRHASIGGTDISSAVLVEIKGKKVILCTKDFLPEKSKAVFSNSKGKIVCSKFYVSDKFPVVMMIPDTPPEKFSAIKIVSPEESFNLNEKELYMIAPSGTGFVSRNVKVFSEDERFLNLTADTAPRINRKIRITGMGRDADKMIVSVTDIVDIGEHAMVIDPESGKLASLAIRYYAPGIIEMGGKTGSIIGHEISNLPDFNTLVRQFDGTVSRTSYKPRSQIYFLRLTALEGWTEITLADLKEQKTSVRRFTDDNNDFLMFFKYNEFGESLRLNRLRDIAERYRRPLLEDYLDRRSFETAYKKYMLEVLYAMRRELLQYKSADSFSPIYRDEMQYQINLRQAMYNYLAESIKEGNMANILHVDLKTRYYDSARPERRSSDSSGNTVVRGARYN